MKKFVALLLAMIMVLSLAACGGKKAEEPAKESAPSQEQTQTPEVKEGGTIGVCIYKFDDAFMTTYRNALQAILEDKGYTVTVVDGNNDQAKQNEQINTFITQGVDALIINPVMTSAAATIISTVKMSEVPTAKARSVLRARAAAAAAIAAEVPHTDVAAAIVITSGLLRIFRNLVPYHHMKIITTGVTPQAMPRPYRPNF